MSSLNTRTFAASTILASAALFGANVHTASAVPITGKYTEDPRCDTIPNQFLTHELGDAAVFPPNEAILVSTQPVNFTVCVPDDGIPNDWVVRIVNVSGIAWKDLFFVCDAGATVGNADGMMEDTILAPSILTDSFRIDGTVTAGINSNLLSESINPNEIFEPGEVWQFAVSNFNPLPGAVGIPPIFQTPGIFAGSSPIGPAQSNASILANPVPEPGTFTVLGLIAGALLMRRPRRK